MAVLTGGSVDSTAISNSNWLAQPTYVTSALRLVQPVTYVGNSASTVVTPKYYWGT